MEKLRAVSIAFAIVITVVMSGRIAAQDVDWDVDEKKPEVTSSPEGPSVVQTIVVNTDAFDGVDSNPGDGICEVQAGTGLCGLRAAITEANALAGHDTITFLPFQMLITINGQIAITSSLSIIGNGPGNIRVQNAAGLSATSRVLDVGNFVVNISGLYLTGGNVTGNGGAINNTGTLTISDCVIADNRASAVGGGIRSTNTLTIHNSTIRQNSSTASTSGGISFAGANFSVRNSTVVGNTSLGNGGGMNLAATASLTIANSTISGNTAGAASGGMFLNRGTVVNSTISGNIANGAAATEGGGGIRIQAGANSVTIASSTITANTAPNAAAGARSGIWHETGALTITSSIVAANVVQDIQRDGTGVITSGGFNLIGENTSVTTEFPAGLPNGTNYVGTDSMPLDPMIGPLGNYGGPTLTHALLVSSVAIDKGSAPGIGADQRLYVRPVDRDGTTNAPGGDGSDIGSYEFQSTPVTAVSISGRVTDAAGNGIPKARVVARSSTGSTIATLTSPFGYYRFDAVPLGGSYVVGVTAKRYVFSSVVITPEGNISDLNFTASP